MYAAAGGASLASRQARLKQKKQNKNERLQQLKSQKVGDIKLPPSRQFQNYTEPKIKLSRVERNALRPPSLQAEARRHSTSHLKEPSRARIKESPSVLIPIQNHLNQAHHRHHHQRPSVTPSTLVQEHASDLDPSCSIPSQLPQICIPEGDDKLERRCSFVRQVEEMGKCHDGGVLDQCNHICNFEVKDKQLWDNNLTYYSEFHRSAFGSLDYPFSERGRNGDHGVKFCDCMSTAASAGMQAALLIREKQRLRRKKFRKGRSELPSNVATREIAPFPRYPPGLWIHDSSYGGESEEDIFAVYHQSAAANALLYVGLGTTAIGSVVFFVGSGDKGFKTLELRLIGPTLVACGLLCCLIRILLCACPSTCMRRRKKTRLKNLCPHSNSSRYPLQQPEKCASEFIPVDHPTASLITKQKKRVSIVQPRPIPGTSTGTDYGLPRSAFAESDETGMGNPKTIPTINIPEFADFSTGDGARLSREGSSIELQNLELAYELESVSSNESDSIVIEVETRPTKLTRTRVPVHTNTACSPDDKETCLSVVVERNDNSDGSGDNNEKTEQHTGGGNKPAESERASHSGILLSPLQLER